MKSKRAYHHKRQALSQEFVLGIDPGKEKHMTVILDPTGLPLGKAFSFPVSCEGFDEVLWEHLRRRLYLKAIKNAIIAKTENHPFLIAENAQKGRMAKAWRYSGNTRSISEAKTGSSMPNWTLHTTRFTKVAETRGLSDDSANRQSRCGMSGSGCAVDFAKACSISWPLLIPRMRFWNCGQRFTIYDPAYAG